MQCCLITYLREVSERRLFGIALPMATTTRWHTFDSENSSNDGSHQRPQRVSEMIGSEMVFSESFSKVIDSPLPSRSHLIWSIVANTRLID
jgi:hypothetical protein